MIPFFCRSIPFTIGSLNSITAKDLQQLLSGPDAGNLVLVDGRVGVLQASRPIAIHAQILSLLQLLEAETSLLTGE